VDVLAAIVLGAAVFPYMDAGASDAIYTDAAGMPTYGISGIAVDGDDARAQARLRKTGARLQAPR
jgi:hypothetical protein